VSENMLPHQDAFPPEQWNAKGLSSLRVGRYEGAIDYDSNTNYDDEKYNDKASICIRRSKTLQHRWMALLLLQRRV
jgi:hypothetical protein